MWPKFMRVPNCYVGLHRSGRTKHALLQMAAGRKSAALQSRYSSTVSRKRKAPGSVVQRNKSSTTSAPNNASPVNLETDPELSTQLNTIVREHGSLSGWAQRLSGSQREQLLQVLRGESTSSIAADEAVVREPTRKELQMVALNQAIPFIGFGIMDNSILILAGDAIDTSLGVTLGISTMCAAAIGNIVADVSGLAFGTMIEDFCANYLRLPVPNLSAAQRQLRSVRFAAQGGCTVGVVIGCIIGMFPLLFIDSNRAQSLKQEAHLDSIFRDVVNEARSLVGAERSCLYILVSPDDSDGSHMPVADGKFLYNKYDDKAAKLDASGKERWIPLGRGIISRAILTGESWNIADVTTEPDFVPELGLVDPRAAVQTQATRSMLCVPVMDSSGRPIAVIQAINKVGKGRDDDPQHEAVPTPLDPQSFTENDVQILKALASHISVSLQRMYEQADDENAEMRLKDTIKMLKKYGLSGLDDDVRESFRKKLERRPLFPED